MAMPAENRSMILNSPALAAPPGVMYQLENPPNINLLCFVVLSIFLGLGILAFGMRMYTKWFILDGIAKEDYCFTLAVLSHIVYSAIAFKLVTVGAGTHQWDLRVKNTIPLLYYTFISELVYNFSALFIRVTILLQYLRIFHATKKATFLYIGCWTSICLIVLFYTLDSFITIFTCTPINKYWDPLIFTGHCLQRAITSIVSGSFNVLSDFVMVLLPQYEIWKLYLSPRKKATVSGIFLVALCACVTSILRLYYTVRLEQTGDVSYNIAAQGLSSVAEISIVITCSCLPVLPRYFQVVVSPKIQYLAKSSFWTKIRSKSSSFSQNVRNGNTGRSSESDRTYADSGDLQAYGQAYGMYKTLDSLELQRLGRKEGGLSGSVREVSGLRSTGSPRGIRVTHQYDIASSPVHVLRDIDLEGQQKVASTDMGW